MEPRQVLGHKQLKGTEVEIIYIFLSLTVCLSVSVCLSVCLSLALSLFFSLSLSVSVRVSVCLSVSVSLLLLLLLERIENNVTVRGNAAVKKNNTNIEF